MDVGFPLHGGNLGWASRRYGLKAEDFLDFSANVNPLGPSPLAIEAVRRSLKDISVYPEPDAGSLRDELASYLGVDPSMLILGNGSTELIHHLCRCLAPSRVVIIAPAFMEYERAAAAASAKIVHHKLEAADAFSLHPPELENTAPCGLIFTCNPASPTGRLYGRDELMGLYGSCRAAGATLVVDESFMAFCPTEKAGLSTLMSEAGSKNLAIVSTLTKVFALAGLRGPGWLVGPPDLVAELEGRAVPWRVNVMALAAARASLGDGDHLRHTREAVRAWREQLSRGLGDIGIFHIFPSEANFLLVRVIDPALDPLMMLDDLGRRGILLRSCANFCGLDESFMRIAVRTPGENERLVAALEDIVSAGSGEP